jgi:DHA2 family multidrug resistance protein
MIGTFMAVLDSTIVNVGLPKIMSAFGVGVDKIEWVLTAYMLAMAVMLPTSGWLADRFGYKKMYSFGLTLFTIGSFLCGISNEENMLIISRVIQGLGAGVIMPIGMAIVVREFPPNKRGLALGFWSIAAAASISFGPLIGGYLVDNFSWQLIFDVNIPVGIAGVLVTLIIQKEYVNKLLRSFDIVGFVSVSIFLPFLLYALTEGNSATNSAGWHAPYIMVCFAVSAIALAIFITTELTVEEPLIDLRLFTNYNFALSNFIMFIFGLGMFGSTFLLPLYLQNALGYSAIQSGAVFLPVGILQGSISPIVGIIGDRTNPKIPIIIGVLILALSFFVNSSLSFLTEHSTIMLALYLRGIGMGVLFTPLSTISLLEIPRDKMAQASGLFNVTRQLGGSFGVAILATIFTIRVNYHTEMYSAAIDAKSQTYANVANTMTYHILETGGSSPAVAIQQSRCLVASHMAREAYIRGIDDDFFIAAIITLIGGAPVLWLHTKKKSKFLKKQTV